MKKVIYSICCCLLIFLSNCAQQNDFKYKGELPKEKYQITELSANNIQYIDGDSTSIRNRIYVNADSVGNLYLNNHLIAVDDFERSYEYIFTNPDRLIFQKKLKTL